MNDRYLYKAKIVEYTGNNVNVGEWVVGCLVVNESATDKFKYRIQPIEDGFLFAPPINPSTICQCTGLKDKNGKLIWENDIMVAHLDDVFPEDETYKRVLWHNNGFCTNENHSKYIEPIDEFDKNHFEVCGNLFDNPELLEVGE